MTNQRLPSPASGTATHSGDQSTRDALPVAVDLQKSAETGGQAMTKACQQKQVNLENGKR
eukprot:m.90873 g.90873  ORF g.90873 m.90873 type:complete len:60 (+) comp11894_c0_seq1:1046-1225(+)